MADTRQYAEATYRVVPVVGSVFGVEVSVPGMSPATVKSFTTEMAAQRWIVDHKKRVLHQAARRSPWARRPY